MRVVASFVIVAIGAVQAACGSSGLNGDAAIARSEAGGASIDGGGTALERIFANSPTYPRLALCDANGACPEGQTCFRLAAELAVCDIAERPVQTACPNTGVDACGCGGPECGAGSSCASVPYSAHFQNDCLQTPCTSPEDCPSASVCTPTSVILGALSMEVPAVGRCFTPTCTSDADCTGGVDGRCAVVMRAPPQFGTGHLDKVGCVFAGRAADATACSPSEATGLLDVTGSTAQYYTCPRR